jgi:hypothetical protein
MSKKKRTIPRWPRRSRTSGFKKLLVAALAAHDQLFQSFYILRFMKIIFSGDDGPPEAFLQLLSCSSGYIAAGLRICF